MYPNLCFWSKNLNKKRSKILDLICKNILLSNIIMTNSFLNIQNGGKRSKERKIKGIRYLSNSDIFLKSNDNNMDLPDSLSSYSENDSIKSKSMNSPFIGDKLKGKALAIYNNNQFMEL